MYGNANSAEIGTNHNPWNKGVLWGPSSCSDAVRSAPRGLRCKHAGMQIDTTIMLMLFLL